MRLFFCMAIVGIALISGCTNIQYIGDRYDPTTQVDIFFSEDDVEYEFKVMGHVNATADDFVSVEKMQEDIVKKAREVGADGIIFVDLDEQITSESTTWSEATKDTDKGTVTSGQSSTSTSKQKQIKCVFIKYKNAGP